MVSNSRIWLCSILGMALCNCSTTDKNAHLAEGAAAYHLVPADLPVASSYLIRPKDTLRVLVVGEPELSVNRMLVDDAGKIHPLIAGAISAAGKTVQEVAADISSRLAVDQLVEPQVTVSVIEYYPRWVTVEGEVKKAGVFEIQGKPTLLTAVSQAGSPSDLANLENVIVLRSFNGEQVGAKFNLARVRTGLDPDPIIMDGDIVVVGQSTTRVVWQNFLRLAPFVAVFARIQSR